MLFADLGIEKAEKFIQEILYIVRLGLSRSWVIPPLKP
jgi:hypothetical protein